MLFSRAGLRRISALHSYIFQNDRNRVLTL
jgi:hypothetical protein